MEETQDAKVIEQTFATLARQQSAETVVPFVYIFRGEWHEKVKLDPVAVSCFDPEQAASQLIQRVREIPLDRIYGAGFVSRGQQDSESAVGFEPLVAI